MTCEGLLSEGQGQNLALTVLYVPYSLDGGVCSEVPQRVCSGMCSAGPQLKCRNAIP